MVIIKYQLSYVNCAVYYNKTQILTFIFFKIQEILFLFSPYIVFYNNNELNLYCIGFKLNK